MQKTGMAGGFEHLQEFLKMTLVLMWQYCCEL